MKKFYLPAIASVLLFVNLLPAQDYQAEYQIFHANDIRTLFSTNGSMFWDGGHGYFSQYYVPFQDETSPSAIFTGSLWLGTLDNGQLRLAGQTYSSNFSNNHEFYPGPLNPFTGLPYTDDDLQHFNRIWSVERHDVEQHIADFDANHVIDHPLFSVVGWPGHGNPYFKLVNGFDLPNTPAGAAPFFDQNNDGIYNAFDGDYPLPEGVAPGVVPEQMVWLVYNDAAGPHGETNGLPLGVEVQLTAWAFRCYENPLLNNTLFVSQKIINRSGRDYTDVYAGVWTDIEIGCNWDDYIGCAPALNSYFGYNATPHDDEDCGFGPQGYGAFPPVQSVTLLNQEMRGFHVQYNSQQGSPYVEPMTDPHFTADYFNYLTGKWKDGLPLTYGGHGYDSTMTNPPTLFAFPDDPNDSTGWSQYSKNLQPHDPRGLGTVHFDSFKNGEVKKIDVAYSTHFDHMLNHVEQVGLVYEEIPKIKNWYATGFTEGTCIQPQCDDDCIWPGDTNHDGIADQYDLLAIGQGVGTDGPARFASNIWSPQTGGDWPQSQFSGVNFKHLDADGNGQVEPADFNLAKLHYGKFREEYVKRDSYIPDGPFFITTSADVENGVVEKSDDYINLFVRKQPIDSLLGFALTLEFDTAFFEDIGFTQTLWNTCPYYLSDQRDEEGRFTGEVHFAIFDGGNNCPIDNEKIFSVFGLQPQITLPGTSTTIRFKNIRALLKNGKEIDLGGQDLALSFSGFGSKAIPKKESGLVIYPNPSEGVFYFHLDQEEIGDWQIFDATGRMMDVRPELHQRDFMVDLRGYASAVYFLRLTRQQTSETWILVVRK